MTRTAFPSSYVGEATERLLREATFFGPAGAELSATGHLADRVPLRLGPFAVTPLLVDHSAFDAYALLVEAGGRRLFYSADLRGHGRKAALFERLLSEPPRDIDTLLLEGTNIRPSASTMLSERDVEDRCTELFSETNGMALVCFSAQNIDRLVTLYRGAKRSGRLFVMDLYAATMARATGLATIPQADWDDVRVFVPLSQRVKVKTTREFHRVERLRDRRLFPEDLTGQAQRLVMTFRSSMAIELERAECLEGSAAVWSMWAGYLEEPSGRRLQSWLTDREIPLEVVHSSGHASVDDLRRLASAIDARAVVPVHTRNSEAYARLFDRTRIHADGEWWDV